MHSAWTATTRDRVEIGSCNKSAKACRDIIIIIIIIIIRKIFLRHAVCEPKRRVACMVSEIKTRQRLLCTLYQKPIKLTMKLTCGKVYVDQ